jgi:hypothetical protein
VVHLHAGGTAVPRVIGPKGEDGDAQSMNPAGPQRSNEVVQSKMNRSEASGV